MSKRLIRVQSLLAKIESTEGVDPSPVAANAVRPAGLLTFEAGAEVQNLRDDVVSETIAKLGPLPPGAKFGALSIPWHVRGFGLAYSAANLPEADPLIRACGLSQTVVTTGGSESVTYELRSTGQESCAIYFYLDGKLHKLLGCRGDLVLSLPAGQPGTVTFSMRGLYNTPTDTALVGGSYQSAVPPLFKAANSLVYNAVSSLITRSFEARLGNTVAARLNANATDALAGYHIPERTPEASFVCEDPLVATADFEADYVAATARVLDTQLGATQYNRCKTHFDKFTPLEPRYSNDAGFSVVTVPGRVSIEGTEDFALIFD